MEKKLDINSEAFLIEKQKTIDFVNMVQKKKGWFSNPDNEINESVLIGLTRNQIFYGIRYCPCFVVKGKTVEEQKKANNRICPCKIGVKEEIPTEGKCHCGIYCTSEYAKNTKIEFEAEVVAHLHSRGLSEKECNALLAEDQLDGKDIEALLYSREEKNTDFVLIDVREWNEWNGKRIDGTDLLLPTSSYYESIESLSVNKEMPIIVYCFSGSRSRYIQKMMRDKGYKSVSNLRRGIMSFSGKTISGETK